MSATAIDIDERHSHPGTGRVTGVTGTARCKAAGGRPDAGIGGRTLAAANRELVR